MPLNPPLLEDKNAISYIAVNPVNSNQIVIGKFEINSYVSSDAGDTWQQLVSQGTGVN